MFFLDTSWTNFSLPLFDKLKLYIVITFEPMMLFQQKNVVVWGKGWQICSLLALTVQMKECLKDCGGKKSLIKLS